LESIGLFTTIIMILNTSTKLRTMKVFILSILKSFSSHLSALTLKLLKTFRKL